MRVIPGVAGLVLAGAVALGLCACVPPARPVIPTVPPTVAPVFASPGEALAAAKKAYEGYLAVSDAVARDGGKGVERLVPFETPEQYQEDVEAFKDIEKDRLHIRGASSYENFTLQRFSQSTSGVVEIGAYVCLDVSKTRLLSNTNNDVTPKGTSVYPLQVTFKSKSPGSENLLIAGSESWLGNNFCS